jgi:hypothetical protein
VTAAHARPVGELGHAPPSGAVRPAAAIGLLTWAAVLITTYFGLGLLSAGP